MLRAPLADLERALIDTFVHARGVDDQKLAELPEREREALLKEASVYASTKLAEVEMRAHYLHDIHE
ncbi:MAG TPA: hypothetical protein VES67_26150 [Vicinamibacterales bacterium]|nr:hypothetical protein [Vicinamibacterales bacterium]